MRSEKLQALKARKDTLGSSHVDTVKSLTNTGMMCKQTGALEEAEIEVQHITYGPSCLQQMQAWREAGVIRPSQNRVLFVLGQYAPPKDAVPGDLESFVSTLGQGDWKRSVCAFGGEEHSCLQAAVSLGFGARIGFENSICDRNGVQHRDNAASIGSFLRASVSGTV